MTDEQPIWLQFVVSYTRLPDLSLISPPGYMIRRGVYFIMGVCRVHCAKTGFGWDDGRGGGGGKGRRLPGD